jgi:hypothetical protein
MKNAVQWEPSCSMRIDGRTEKQRDTTKLIIAFRNFANASKNDPKFQTLLYVTLCIMKFFGDRNVFYVFRGVRIVAKSAY